jgi:ketosteroid isomerase-like protein
MRSCTASLVIALFACWTLNVAVAQGKADALPSKLLALEKEWNTAYYRGDIATMNSLLAEDFIITIEDGRTFSKSGYIALNGNSTVHVEVSEMSEVKVRMHGTTTAVVTGMYHEKGVSKGQPYEYHDRFTDVWMNINGKWQVIASHYAIPSSQ